MPSIHDRFADEIVAQAVDLQRLEGTIRRRVLGDLKALEIELAERIQALQLTGLTDTVKFRRLESLLRRTRSTIRGSMRKASQTLARELVELAEFTQDSTVAIMDGVLQGSVTSTAFTRQELNTLARGSLIQGAPSADWWDGQTDTLRRRFESELRLGVTAGETNEQLVRRVRGEATGRRRVVEIGGRRRILPEFDGGILNTSTRRASDLVRTSVQTVSNEVILETYKENDDLVEGVQALVTLDGRTTDICISRSGAQWDLKTGKPLPGSSRNEKFPGHPPWHWGCRSTLIPITKSWADIVEEATGERLELFEGQFNRRARAALGGPVAGDLNYEGWLRTRPRDFQLDVLGPGRYKLWKDGKITLSQLVDNTGRPLTIEQLRNRRNLVKRAPGKRRR